MGERDLSFSNMFSVLVFGLVFVTFSFFILSILFPPFCFYLNWLFFSSDSVCYVISVDLSLLLPSIDYDTTLSYHQRCD